MLNAVLNKLRQPPVIGVLNLGWLAGTVVLFLVSGGNGWLVAGGVVAFLLQLRFLWLLKHGEAVPRTWALGLLNLTHRGALRQQLAKQAQAPRQAQPDWIR